MRLTLSPASRDCAPARSASCGSCRRLDLAGSGVAAARVGRRGPDAPRPASEVRRIVDDALDQHTAVADRVLRSAAAPDERDVVVVQLAAELIVEGEGVARAVRTGVDIENLEGGVGIAVLHHL